MARRSNIPEYGFVRDLRKYFVADDERRETLHNWLKAHPDYSERRLYWSCHAAFRHFVQGLGWEELKLFRVIVILIRHGSPILKKTVRQGGEAYERSCPDSIVPPRPLARPDLFASLDDEEGGDDQ